MRVFLNKKDVQLFRAIIFSFMIGLLVMIRSAFCGDYTADFLNIGIGARALSMGGAFCSIGGDGSAFYWNPSGLALLKRAQISGMYGPQFGTIANPMGNYHHIGFAQPLPGNAVVSVNWIRLAVDDIPIYPGLKGDSYWDRLHDPSLRPSGDPEGYFSDTEDALFFSFALRNRFQMDMGWQYHSIPVEIPIGVNIKWIRQVLGEGEASGVGLDLGGMIRFPLGAFFDTQSLGMLAIGVHLQDITGTRLSWNTKHQDTLPLNVKWGVSYEQKLPLKNSAIVIAYDRDSRWRGKQHFGAELSLLKTLSLRAGLDDGNFTGGAGLRIWKVNVDYAFLSHELNSLHRISCSITL